MEYLFEILIISAMLACIGYLLGSVSFAIVVTKLFKHVDVRNYGSGNAGFTNTLRVAGKWPSILTMLGDVAKGVVAALFGAFVFSHLGVWGLRPLDPIYGGYIAGFFCFLGHLYPLYYGFKGGKGVLVSLAVGLSCNWKGMLISLGIFLIVFLITKIISVSSITAAFSWPIVTLFVSGSTLDDKYMFLINQRLFEGIVAILLASILILKHSSNLTRLLNGEEKKITKSKKPKTAATGDGQEN